MITKTSLSELDLGFEWGNFSAAPSFNDKLLSRHPGGVMVSFCDGHQQFLQNSINVNVLKHLMTPSSAGAFATTLPNTTGPTGVLDEAAF